MPSSHFCLLILSLGRGKSRAWSLSFNAIIDSLSVTIMAFKVASWWSVTEIGMIASH